MNDTLQHHGIEGQKWGVRRYQNADGSLTAAGKKHVSGSDSSGEKKKDVKSMSDQELRSSINRLQMENQYNSLTSKKSVVSKGASFVKAAAAATGTVVALYNNSNTLISIGKKFAGKLKR